MSNSPISPQRHRTPTWLRWITISLLALVVVLVVLFSISNWNWARGGIASILSSHLHRNVQIQGPLSAHLLSTTPSIQVEKIVVANPEWLKQSDFINIEKLSASLNLRSLFSGHLLLETLEVSNPNVSIVQNADGRNNFTFGVATKDKTSQPPDLPGVKLFTLHGGHLSVTDDVHKLEFEGRVEANEGGVKANKEPFRLRGHGQLNSKPFDLTFKGGPLANLKMDQPYAFDANVTAGQTHALAHGSFHKPFDFATVTTHLDIKGENLAHLYYLTGLSLPFTPPYHVLGELSSGEKKITVNKLDSTVGNSDVHGDVTVELSKPRVRLIAHLKSHSLRLADLSPAFGKGVTVDPKSGATLDSAAPKELPPTKLFPTYEFKFDRLRSMDADVTLHADAVQTDKLPIDSVDIHLKLDDGVLAFDPVVFTLQQGKLSGTVAVDARQPIAHTKLNVRFSDVKLAQFKSKSARESHQESPLTGTLQTRAQLEGNGNSVHDIAASANGMVTAVVPHGEIRKSFAELTGIDIARGLGLLLTGSKDRTSVRCGIATFKIQDGDAKAEQIVFDTQPVLITASGNIDLNKETLDLDAIGKPKKVRLLRLRAPINIRGTLRKPKVSLDAGKTASQVGIAAALNVLLTPLAAALAFIDPGLAKDADCAALLADAKKTAATESSLISSKATSKATSKTTSKTLSSKKAASANKQ